MVFIQNALRPRHIELVFRVLQPRQIQNPIHVVARHRIVGGRRIGARQTLQLLVELLAGFFGELLLTGSFPQLLDFVAASALAQLLLNGLHLLAQQVLALLFIDVGFDARSDFFR